MPNVRHRSFGEWFDQPSDATDYLTLLKTMWASDWFDNTDLILYQAGVDCHVDDPLGGVLTTEEMRLRDRMMFEGAKKRGIPLVFNLAGGYQTPVSKVVSLHVNTMEECLTI